ncbi:toll/interleukin-1 receptor domain-containing protein [Actinomycetospora sp. C-140]
MRGSRTIEVRRLDPGRTHDHSVTVCADTPGPHTLAVHRLVYVAAGGRVTRTSGTLVVTADVPPPAQAPSPRPPRQGSVFVSYRRDDTGPAVDRLAPALHVAFPDRVFHDHTSLRPGDLWSRRLERELAESVVVLAVIGPSWLEVETADGRRRLEDEDDWVRRELVSALDAELDVVPVLVDGASMPRERQLPPVLRPLCEREAYDLPADPSGVDALVAVLRNMLGER